MTVSFAARHFGLAGGWNPNFIVSSLEVRTTSCMQLVEIRLTSKPASAKHSISMNLQADDGLRSLRRTDNHIRIASR